MCSASHRAPSSSPGSWTAACSPSVDVHDDHGPASDYRWARQVSALLLIAVIVVIVLLDALIDDYDVSTGVLVPLLLTVAGLLSVDLPRLRS
jgi:hypothetical protein